MRRTPEDEDIPFWIVSKSKTQNLYGDGKKLKHFPCYRFY